MFNVIIRNASNAERRLLRSKIESYNDDIIDDVFWIRRAYNLADSMTKATIIPQIVHDGTVRLACEIEEFEKIINMIPYTTTLNKNNNKL